MVTVSKCCYKVGQTKDCYGNNLLTDPYCELSMELKLFEYIFTPLLNYLLLTVIWCVTVLPSPSLLTGVQV